MDIANLMSGLGVNYLIIGIAAIHTVVGIFQIKNGTMTRPKHYIRFALMAVLGVIAVIATVKGVIFTEYIHTLRSQMGS